MSLTCKICKHSPVDCHCTPSAIKRHFENDNPLFAKMQKPEPHKLARKADPETSKEAARGSVLNGDVERARWAAMQLVVAHGPATGSELADFDDHHDSRHVGRRLSELERDGLIIRGDPRKCHVTGRNAATWVKA